ncbi:hypothetical protein ACRAWD_25335 [Caulobacter segnis]
MSPVLWTIDCFARRRRPDRCAAPRARARTATRASGAAGSRAWQIKTKASAYRINFDISTGPSACELWGVLASTVAFTAFSPNSPTPRVFYPAPSKVLEDHARLRPSYRGARAGPWTSRSSPSSTVRTRSSRTAKAEASEARGWTDPVGEAPSTRPASRRLWRRRPSTPPGGEIDTARRAPRDCPYLYYDGAAAACPRASVCPVEGNRRRHLRPGAVPAAALGLRRILGLPGGRIPISLTGIVVAALSVTTAW